MWCLSSRMHSCASNQLLSWAVQVNMGSTMYENKYIGIYKVYICVWLYTHICIYIFEYINILWIFLDFFSYNKKNIIDKSVGPNRKGSKLNMCIFFLNRESDQPNKMFPWNIGLKWVHSAMARRGFQPKHLISAQLRQPEWCEVRALAVCSPQDG